MTHRAALVALADEAPAGLGPLAQTALGLFDRGLLQEYVRCMLACAAWAGEGAWFDRVIDHAVETVTEHYTRLQPMSASKPSS
jgi:hypothetical protein